jgi:hypothetical protein
MAISTPGLRWRATATTATMSITVSVGFDGDSNHSSFVLGNSADSTESAARTNEVATPRGPTTRVK